MTDLAYCPQGGWLVSRYPLPEDPADHWTWGVGADIGCNHLVCSGCGEAVRDARLSPKRGSLTKELKEMARTEDWSQLPYLERTYAHRLYACECFWTLQVGKQLAQDEDPDVRADTAKLPWACGGHPSPTLPLTVDGLSIDASTDFDALVRRMLDEGASEDGPVSWHEFPASWLGRVYYRLRGLPEADTFARAVGDLLFSSETAYVGAALVFYRRWPHAPGNQRVIELGDAVGDSTIFFARHEDGSDAPHSEQSVAAALAVFAKLSDVLEPAMLARLEDALCAPNGAGLSARQVRALFDLVAKHDPEFLARSAGTAARNDPSLADNLLSTLRKTGRAELVVVGGTALIAAGGYQEGIERFLDSTFSHGEPWTPVLRLAMAAGSSE